ncbi:MAG TPA: thiamine biosynthesis protein ApbE [Lachnospiraceae bacterium]|nr:thiamine biosynthesis protein ApbE [Lachnospiraceae bacterium]
MNISKKILSILISAVLLVDLPLSGCSPGSYGRTPVSLSFFALNTLSTITIYTSLPGIKASEVLDSCRELVLKYEDVLSRTKKTSDIYRINHSAGRPVTVSETTLELIRKGIEYSELSNGMFDITIAPVIELWGFGTDEMNGIPDKAALKEALSHVSFRNILLDEEALTVQLADPASKLDLGAIAKGYIADRVKERLKESGVTGAVIDLGGNILTLGSKPGGKPFNVAIKAPFTDTSSYYMGRELPEDSIAASVEITDRSVVTSGIYERYRLVDGVMYHHILDPRTGFPVDNTLASATVISDTSLEGDCLSTVCLLLGRKQAEALIKARPRLQAILIEKDGTVTRVNSL